MLTCSKIAFSVVGSLVSSPVIFTLINKNSSLLCGCCSCCGCIKTLRKSHINIWKLDFSLASGRCWNSMYFSSDLSSCSLEFDCVCCSLWQSICYCSRYFSIFIKESQQQQQVHRPFIIDLVSWIAVWFSSAVCLQYVQQSSTECQYKACCTPRGNNLHQYKHIHADNLVHAVALCVFRTFKRSYIFMEWIEVCSLQKKQKSRNRA